MGTVAWERHAAQSHALRGALHEAAGERTRRILDPLGHLALGLGRRPQWPGSLRADHLRKPRLDFIPPGRGSSTRAFRRSPPRRARTRLGRETIAARLVRARDALREATPSAGGDPREPRARRGIGRLRGCRPLTGATKRSRRRQGAGVPDASARRRAWQSVLRHGNRRGRSWTAESAEDRRSRWRRSSAWPSPEVAARRLTTRRWTMLFPVPIRPCAMRMTHGPSEPSSMRNLMMKKFTA
jgi:hypothetical protein